MTIGGKQVEMTNINQNHSGKGDNVGRDKIINVFISSGIWIFLLLLIIAGIVLLIWNKEFKEKIALNDINSEKDSITFLVDWDSVTAQKIIFRELQEERFKFKCSSLNLNEEVHLEEGQTIDGVYDGEQLKHSLIGFYDYHFFEGINTKIIGVAISYPEFSDEYMDYEKFPNPCGVQISLLEFTWYQGSWILKAKFIPAILDSDWEDYLSNIEVVKLGVNILGLLLIKDGDEGRSQGYVTGRTRVFAVIDNEMKEIFAFEHSYDETAAKELPQNVWKNVLHIKDFGTELYDIILTKEGLIDGIERIDTIEYEYNGSEYVEKRTFGAGL